MSKIAEIVDRLVATGMSAGEAAEMVFAAIGESAVSADSSADRRRAKDRERKASVRRIPRNSADIPQTVSDATVRRIPQNSAEFRGHSNVALSIEDNNINNNKLKREKRASRIPPDWQPDEVFARGQGLDSAATSLEAEKFRNYWSAKSGRDATKLDWAATWRNWIIRVCEQRGISPAAAPKTGDAARGWTPGKRTSDEIMAELREKQNAEQGHAGLESNGSGIRRPEQGMVSDEPRQPGIFSLGSVLSKTGLGAVGVEAPKGSGEPECGVHGAMPIPGMASRS